MAQQHLDRLTSTDASFLHQEGTASHMPLGAVRVFEGPPPAFDDFLDHVRGRLHLVPRYRQKLATPPLETGRPLWVDDPDFNLEYHVLHNALPAPGPLPPAPPSRQNPPPPPLETGRPLWVDDPDFNLEYHVRHTALPAPGTEEQLFLLTGRIASQQLDRAKPLWESWLVEGLEGDRFALVFKTHHALVDGVSGVDLATVLFDFTSDPPPPPPAPRPRHP